MNTKMMTKKLGQEEYENLENLNLLTMKDVASLMKISKSMAYQLTQTKQIRGVRIGRAVRVRPADLHEYINNCLSMH